MRNFFTASLFVAPLFVAMLCTSAARADVFGSDDPAGFRADVYASPKSALDAVARGVVETIKNLADFQEQGAAITVAGDFNDTVGAALRSAFPQSSISISKADEKLIADNSYRVTISLQKITRPGAVWGSSDLESGIIAGNVLRGGTIKFGARTTSFTVGFVDKPWADDRIAFVNREPKQKWLIAESPRPCITEREADEEALQVAAAELWPAVREQMQLDARGKTKIMVTPEYAVQQIGSALSRGIGVKDQFVQRFTRPYGNVWRKMLLIDASPQSIQAISRHISSVAWADRDDKIQQRNEQVAAAGSTLALVGVIVLLYFFVNAVTKGYFVWRLRAIALLVAIAGILAVIATR